MHRQLYRVNSKMCKFRLLIKSLKSFYIYFQVFALIPFHLKHTMLHTSSVRAPHAQKDQTQFIFVTEAK